MSQFLANEGDTWDCVHFAAKTTTGFAPNDRGVASDDLVVDNPMSGRADCTNVGISGHCGLPPALTIVYTTGILLPRSEQTV